MTALDPTAALAFGAIGGVAGTLLIQLLTPWAAEAIGDDVVDLLQEGVEDR